MVEDNCVKGVILANGQEIIEGKTGDFNNRNIFKSRNIMW